MEFIAEDISVLPFQPALVRWGDNHASAFAVTLENIGRVALDMQRDLLYIGQYNQGTPYFTFMATRFEEEPIELTITPGVWVILLWGEVHVFRDDVFRNTFVIEMSDPGPEKEDAAQEALWKVVPPEATLPEAETDLEKEEAAVSGKLYRDAMAAGRKEEGMRQVAGTTYDPKIDCEKCGLTTVCEDHAEPEPTQVMKPVEDPYANLPGNPTD